MRIDPAIRALRSDPGSQRRAHAAMTRAKAAWEAEPSVRAALGQFVQYAAGEAVEELPALQRLVTDHVFARRAFVAWQEIFAKALREEPLAQIPYRHQFSNGLSVLQLAIAGEAALSILHYPAMPGTHPPPTACFADAERFEMVLEGSASARMIRLEEWDRITVEMLDLAGGDAMALTDDRATRQVLASPTGLTMLRLSRTPASPRPSREYRLADGALVHQASGSRRDSQREMMVAALGAMRHGKAAHALAGVAGERDASDHLRWQALSQCLCLDTATGYAALAGLASDADDTLAGPAGALRAQLLEYHPALSQLEKDTQPCPA